MKLINILVILMLFSSIIMISINYYDKNRTSNTATYEELTDLINKNKEYEINNIKIIEDKDNILNLKTNNIVESNISLKLEKEKDNYIIKLMKDYNVSKKEAEIIFKRQNFVR